MAEDLRAARARLGITSGQAARRTGVAAARYRALERAGFRVVNTFVSVSAFGYGICSSRLRGGDRTVRESRRDWRKSRRSSMFWRRMSPNSRTSSVSSALPPSSVTWNASGRRDAGAEAGGQADGGTVDRSGVHDVPRRDYYVPVKDDPAWKSSRSDSRAPMMEICRTYSESVFGMLAKRYERGTVLVVAIEETRS